MEMIYTKKNIGLTKEKLHITEEICKKDKICLYNGCSQPAIKGHSIQKKIIASFPDNGKLMSPSMPNSGISNSPKGDMREVLTLLPFSMGFIAIIMIVYSRLLKRGTILGRRSAIHYCHGHIQQRGK